MKQCVIVLLMLLNLDAWAQTHEKDSIGKNMVFFEAFGSSLVYSINYERIILDNNRLNLSVRGGFMMLPDLNADSEGYTMAFPTGINLSLGSDAKSLVLGTGFTPWLEATTGGMDANDDDMPRHDWSSYTYFKIGTRKVYSNGVFFEASLFTFYDLLTNNFMPPIWIGISLGYPF